MCLDDTPAARFPRMRGWKDELGSAYSISRGRATETTVLPTGTSGRESPLANSPSRKLPGSRHPQPGSPSPEPSPTQLRSKPRSRHAERTTGRGDRPRSARNYNDRSPRQDGRRPSSSESASYAELHPSRTRPDARPAPRIIGNTAGRPRSGQLSRGTKPPVRLGSSDNSPDPGRGDPSSRPGTGASRDV